MAHYKQLLDPGKFLSPADFPPEGKEITISRINREAMPERKGEDKQSAPMLYIKSKDGTEYARPYKVPKSVLFGLSVVLGTETDAWKDQKITIFSTFCMSFGDKEECLRVKFPAEIDAKVRKWLKKRKASPSAYMLPSTTTTTDEAPE